MAYAHCHNCGWEQDDFWDKSYNPVKSLLHWESDLLEPYKLIQQFSDDPEFIRTHGNITRQELIAREFERAAERIRTMAYFTADDMNNNDGKCPKCSAILDVD